MRTDEEYPKAMSTKCAEARSKGWAGATPQKGGKIEEEEGESSTPELLRVTCVREDVIELEVDSVSLGNFSKGMVQVYPGDEGSCG
jgi:hypothetical protein